ncbi:hypothetical protein IKE97_01635 [Candidatus Saccharibacteria bacterium]|nr:hypothetical protein [Candidatus Saccharibacteria bacterium]
MPKDYRSYLDCTDSMPNFGIICAMILAVSVVVLVLQIMDKKAKYRIQIVSLMISTIVLSAVCVILSFVYS